MSTRRVVGYSVLALILLLAPATTSSSLPWAQDCDAGATGPGPPQSLSIYQALPGASAGLDPSGPNGEGESISPLRAAWRSLTNRRKPEALLRRALQRAQRAETYRVDIDLQQTITLLDASSLEAASESARFQIEGTIGGRERARFSILPAAASFAPAKQDPEEFLIVDSDI
jgi:hypothetical protein